MTLHIIVETLKKLFTMKNIRLQRTKEVIIILDSTPKICNTKTTLQVIIIQEVDFRIILNKTKPINRVILIINNNTKNTKIEESFFPIIGNKILKREYF